MEKDKSQEVMDIFRSQRNFYFERTYRNCWITILGLLIVKYHNLIIFDKFFLCGIWRNS